MHKKRTSLAYPELAEIVNFVDVDTSGESSVDNEISGDPLQDGDSNIESCKAQTQRNCRKRRPVLATEILQEQSQPVKCWKMTRLRNLIVKREPIHESNEDGEQGSCGAVALVGRIKRELTEPDQDQSEINTKGTVKSKRFKNDQDSDVTSNVAARKELMLTAEPTKVLENLAVKYELILEEDEGDKEVKETTPMNWRKIDEMKGGSHPEKVQMINSVRVKHRNPKVMRPASTAVFKKNMRDTKPEKKFGKVKEADVLKKPSITEEESESSGSDETGRRMTTKKEAEKPKVAWNPELMILAVNAVRAKKMGSTRAARVFQIPKSILLKYLNEEMANEEIIVPCSTRGGGRKRVFTPEQEEDLKKYLLYVQERYFGLAKEEVKSIVLQFTKLKAITGFGPAGNPGFSWIKAFLRRHNSIVPQHPRELRKHSSVSKFFALIKREVEANHYSANMIFNVDETAFSIVHSKNPQFRLMKRQEQVLRAKKDSYLTVITCMGAAGNFVPPMFIFPRHKATSELMRGAPPGAVATCHPSGWVQLELFTQWFRHFLNATKPTKENPALLILDGQQSHTKNIEVIRLAQENHVSIISLPPLTLNKLQPVYKSFMDPLKTFYSEEVRKWMNQNLRPLSLDVVVELFSKAYLQVLDCNIGVKGFRDTGIMPLNPEMVSQDFPDLKDEDLEGAKVEKFLTHMMDHLSSPDELNSVKLKLKPSTSEAPDSQKYPSLREVLRLPVSEEFSEEDEESDTEYSVANIKSEIEVECMFCRQLQSEDATGEKWVQCMSCDLWSHYECAGYDEGDYVCDYCKLNK